MAKYLALINGRIKEVLGLSSSAGAADAGKIPELDGSGRLDSSMMPVGFGSETKVIQASENLAAGDFVNIHVVSSAVRVRKADASNGRVAHGFVLNSVTSGQNATVYYGNLNTAVSGRTIGVEQYLSASTAGAVVETPPTGSGHIVQRLGVATGTTEMLVEIQTPIELT
jgi:hypothetical protein